VRQDYERPLQRDAITSCRSYSCPLGSSYTRGLPIAVGNRSPPWGDDFAAAGFTLQARRGVHQVADGCESDTARSPDVRRTLADVAAAAHFHERYTRESLHEARPAQHGPLIDHEAWYLISRIRRLGVGEVQGHTSVATIVE